MNFLAGLAAKGIKEAKNETYINTGITTVSFDYNGKQYTIRASKNAAESQFDTKRNSTYTLSDLKNKYGLSDALIEAYFVLAQDTSYDKTSYNRRTKERTSTTVHENQKYIIKPNYPFKSPEEIKETTNNAKTEDKTIPKFTTPRDGYIAAMNIYEELSANLFKEHPELFKHTDHLGTVLPAWNWTGHVLRNDVKLPTLLYQFEVDGVMYNVNFTSPKFEENGKLFGPSFNDRTAGNVTLVTDYCYGYGNYLQPSGLSESGSCSPVWLVATGEVTNAPSKVSKKTDSTRTIQVKRDGKIVNLKVHEIQDITFKSIQHLGNGMMVIDFEQSFKRVVDDEGNEYKYENGEWVLDDYEYRYPDLIDMVQDKKDEESAAAKLGYSKTACPGVYSQTLSNGQTVFHVWNSNDKQFERKNDIKSVNSDGSYVDRSGKKQDSYNNEQIQARVLGYTPTVEEGTYFKDGKYYDYNEGTKQFEEVDKELYKFKKGEE